MALTAQYLKAEPVEHESLAHFGNTSALMENQSRDG